MRCDHTHIPKLTRRIDADDQLEAFFHSYFHNGVDCEPGRIRTKYTRYTWGEIYNGEYKKVLKTCDSLQIIQLINISIVSIYASRWILIMHFVVFVKSVARNTNGHVKHDPVGGTTCLAIYVISIKD